MSTVFTKPPVLLDGETAFADDVNILADRTDAAFDLVESLATTQAASAALFADEAEAWATTAEDTEVEAGKYSSLHYSLKAAADASSADADASTATAQAAIATAQAGIATTQAGLAADSAVVAVPRTASYGSAVIPVGPTVWRDDPATEGYLRFNSTLDKFEGYNGSDWIILDSPRNENLIINGGFQLWQRGESHSTYGYGSADRWRLDFSLADPGTNPAFLSTLSRVALIGGHIYNSLGSVSITNHVAPAATDYVKISQRIEGVHRVSNEHITVSFTAKGSVAGRQIAVRAGQNFGTGGSSSLTSNVEAVTLTTTLARYSVTLFISNISSKQIGSFQDDFLEIDFILSAGASVDAAGIGINNSFDFSFTDVQVERGHVSTVMPLRTLAEEERLCYRYYYESPPGMIGVATRATDPIEFFQFFQIGPISLPVKMVSKIPTMAVISLPSLGPSAGTVTLYALNSPGNFYVDFVFGVTDPTYDAARFENFQFSVDNEL